MVIGFYFELLLNPKNSVHTSFQNGIETLLVYILYRKKWLTRLYFVNFRIFILCVNYLFALYDKRNSFTQNTIILSNTSEE